MDQVQHHPSAALPGADPKAWLGTDAPDWLRIRFEAALLESIHDVVFSTDAEGMITYWNGMAETLFGWPSAETLGRSAYWLFAPLIGRRTCLAAVQRLATCGRFVGEIDCRRPDGQAIHADVHAQLILEPEARQRWRQPATHQANPPQPLGAVFSIRDISRYWEIGQALRASEARAMQLVETLQQADRNKNHALNTISHELRNPLAAMTMGLALIRQGAFDAGLALRTVDMMERQAAQLTRLVDDLLDATRIDANKIKLRKSAVDVNSLIGRIIADFRPRFDASGVALSLERREEPLVLEADAERLTQMVANLLDNALKFTERGGQVTVATERLPDPPAVRISVQDNGIGIAPGFLDTLFQPFAQVDTALSRKHGGLGLGLSIVKGLAELHNGRVEANSGGLGKGARFTITLPVELAQRTGRPHDTSRSISCDNQTDRGQDHELDTRTADT